MPVVAVNDLAGAVAGGTGTGHGTVPGKAGVTGTGTGAAAAGSGVCPGTGDAGGAAGGAGTCGAGGGACCAVTSVLRVTRRRQASAGRTCGIRMIIKKATNGASRSWLSILSAFRGYLPRLETVVPDHWAIPPLSAPL
jgi:hypothetical protein